MSKIIHHALQILKKSSFIFIVACLFYGCKNKDGKERLKLKEIENLPANFLANCQFVREDSAFLYIDKENNIKLPFLRGWDVEPIKEDNLNGLYAIDTSAYLENEAIHTLTINFFPLKQNLSLKEHFLAELNGLKKDSIPVLETGTVDIDNRPGYWLLSSKELNSKDILFYLKDPRRKNIVVTILISVSDSPSYKNDLCSIFNNIIDQISFLPFSKLI